MAGDDDFLAKPAGSATTGDSSPRLHTSPVEQSLAIPPVAALRVEDRRSRLKKRGSAILGLKRKSDNSHPSHSSELSAFKPEPLKDGSDTDDALSSSLAHSTSSAPRPMQKTGSRARIPMMKRLKDHCEKDKEKDDKEKDDEGSTKEGKGGSTSSDKLGRRSTLLKGHHRRGSTIMKNLNFIKKGEKSPSDAASTKSRGQDGKDSNKAAIKSDSLPLSKGTASVKVVSAAGLSSEDYDPQLGTTINLH